MKDDMWLVKNATRLVVLIEQAGSWSAEEQDWAKEYAAAIERNFKQRFGEKRGQQLLDKIKDELK